MSLNRRKGRIPNSIKEMAKTDVDKYGAMAYHYACYNCSFDGDEICLTFDYPLIDSIVKECKKRGIW